MDVVQVTSKGQLVVPARLRRKYGIEPGTTVRFVERDNEIVFQPLTREYIQSVCGMLRSKALGLTIPPSVLARADELIQ